MESSREILDSIRTDAVSGSSVLFQRAVDFVEASLDEQREVSGDVLACLLAELADKIGSAHPTMAALTNLAARLRKLAGRVQDSDDVRRLTSELRRYQAESLHRIAQLASELIPALAKVMVISDSGTLRAIVKEILPKEVTWIVPESRPDCEGRNLAKYADGLGAATILTTDLAAFGMVNKADLFLCGADSVSREAVINKVGTRAFAAWFASAGKDVLCAFDTFKISPREVAIPELAASQPQDSPEFKLLHGKVVSPIFETCSISCFTHFITERGIFSPDSVDSLIDDVLV